MELSATQKDTLTELINIGYARAAGALSELTGHRITLAPPQVDIHKIEEISAILLRLVNEEVAAVNQIFGGPISGNAILLLDAPAARLLNQLLTNRPEATELDYAGREVITEVGNIVLNACLGVFGNLLQVQVNFTVPALRIDEVTQVLNSITVGDEGLSFGLMIHTRFHLRASDVTGYLMMILGLTSLERLMSELEKWEARQLA